MDKSKLKTEENLEYCLSLLRVILKKTNITFKRVSLYLGKKSNYISHVLGKSTTLNMKIFFEILELYEITPIRFFSDDFQISIYENKNLDELKKLKSIANEKLEKFGI